MAKDWMKALNKLEGAVAKEANPFAAGYAARARA
jgi:hypothetical protein